jgi:hypothetical protein
MKRIKYDRDSFGQINRDKVHNHEFRERSVIEFEKKGKY